MEEAGAGEMKAVFSDSWLVVSVGAGRPDQRPEAKNEPGKICTSAETARGVFEKKGRSKEGMKILPFIPKGPAPETGRGSLSLRTGGSWLLLQ
jgi:hypothetical protein